MFFKKKPGLEEINPTIFLIRFFATLGLLLLLGLGIFAPYSMLWLYQSGDAAVERAVAAQSKGEFAVFGSALSQDFVDYKLQLYAATRPEIIAIGSSRAMQFRGAWFTKPFLNMGGVAGNLGELSSTINALLKISRPQAVIIAIDFWWFMPQWEADPEEYIAPTSGSYNYNPQNLKKPWTWLLEGKISLSELLAPVFGIFGKGMAADRYGILAQQTNDGFGPDGSWYYTAEISGQKPPFDFQFLDTLKQVEYGIKAFYHAPEGQRGPANKHLEVFSDICCRLKARGIAIYVFIPPLSGRVFEEIRSRGERYPHLFNLRQELAQRGIEAMDFSDPRSFAASDCEFVDGFHGGEVAYARILRHMADHWPKLLAYVNMDRLEAVIRDWKNHAMVPDARLTARPEIDFMDFGCPKRQESPSRR